MICPLFSLRFLIVEIIELGGNLMNLMLFPCYKVYPSQTIPSPDVMCEAALNGEEVTDVKTLTEKLSVALLNSSAKEELVKQHAKVAEEAVSGICCLAVLEINNFLI